MKAVRIKLDEDPKLQDRTLLSRERILGLLSFCLNTTYFTYSGVIYKQEHGAAMGSPMSPIIASLYMEGFEDIALRTAPNPILSVVQVRGRYIYRDQRLPRRWVHYPPKQPGLQHQVHNWARARWQIALPRCMCKHQRGLPEDQWVQTMDIQGPETQATTEHYINQA